MKYLVLGGSAAGMSFAAKMRRNDSSAEIVVIEKRDYVSFGACGLPYYVGDYFTDSNDMLVRTPEAFREQGIDLRIKEEVTNIDFSSKVVTIKNSEKEYTESYDKLIIATGASPIVFNGIEVDHKRVFTLASKEDGETLKEVVKSNNDKTFTIIGSGFIGLELMDALIEQNINVNVLTRDKYIMDALYDKAIIDDIQSDLQKIPNLNLQLDTNIGDINILESSIEVSINDSKIKTDYLIFAAGFGPNTQFIEELEKLPNGAIITDKNMQTSKEDVYAIGDAATINNIVLDLPVYAPLATGANKSGRALADKFSGVDVPFSGMLSASIIKILDYELGRVGLTKTTLDSQQIKYKEKIVEDKNQTSYYKGQEKIIAKIFYEESTNRILGIEMSGKKGVHGRLDAMSVVISQKLTTKELGYIDFPYAPPFSRTWDFLNVIGNVSK